VPIGFFHSVIEEPILMLNQWWSGLGLSDAGAVCCKDRFGVVFLLKFRSERLAPALLNDWVGFAVRRLVRHVDARHAMSRHGR